MSWDTAATIAAVAVPVLGVAGASARWVGKKWARIDEFIDDWQGAAARPGVSARPGVMARLDAIEHELRPNSGASLRDAVNRVDERTRRAMPTTSDE
jgi:hypothetical protein